MCLQHTYRCVHASKMELRSITGVGSRNKKLPFLDVDPGTLLYGLIGKGSRYLGELNGDVWNPRTKPWFRSKTSYGKCF